MKTFMQYKQLRASQLDAHPFMQWLDGDSVELAHKFDFMPIMTLFIMGFRDTNLWVIRFDEQADEHYRSIINGNTFEDETHSRLFLEDWEKLEIDRKLEWSASDMLSWMFVSPETEIFRRYQVEFVKLCIDDGGDPMLRFAHSEAGEACGHVFFRHSVGPATLLDAATGLEHRYFGHYHLDRELGHVMESEGEFENQVLTPAQRSEALALGERMFDIFDGIFNTFQDYVTTYVERGHIPTPDPSQPPPRVATVDPLPAAELEPPSDAALHLEGLLRSRMLAAAAHPFYSWLQTETSVSAADKLRRFIPMWVMDIMGYRDLNHYVLHSRDDERATPLAHQLDAWVGNLETHSMLFLADWRSLDMDARLGWSASETLEFCFLDPGMDVHRRNIFEFMKMGLRHRDPILRFWLMHALEASGEAFFTHTRELALAAEAEGVDALDYLADRHEKAHPAPPVSKALRTRSFMSEPMTLAQLEIAEQMIALVFDALEHQLDLSLKAAVSDRFGINNQVEEPPMRAIG